MSELAHHETNLPSQTRLSTGSPSAVDHVSGQERTEAAGEFDCRGTVERSLYEACRKRLLSVATPEGMCRFTGRRRTAGGVAEVLREDLAEAAGETPFAIGWVTLTSKKKSYRRLFGQELAILCFELVGHGVAVGCRL